MRNSGTCTGEIGLDRDGKLRIPGKGAAAWSKCPSGSALLAVPFWQCKCLKVYTFGSNPRACISSSSDSACSPPFSHAEMAALLAVP